MAKENILRNNIKRYKMKEMFIDLVREWERYCHTVVSNNPNYVDTDFNFTDFMEYVRGKYLND